MMFDMLPAIKRGNFLHLTHFSYQLLWSGYFYLFIELFLSNHLLFPRNGSYGVIHHGKDLHYAFSSFLLQSPANFLFSFFICAKRSATWIILFYHEIYLVNTVVIKMKASIFENFLQFVPSTLSSLPWILNVLISTSIDLEVFSIFASSRFSILGWGGQSGFLFWDSHWFISFPWMFLLSLLFALILIIDKSCKTLFTFPALFSIWISFSKPSDFIISFLLEQNSKLQYLTTVFGISYK